MLLTLGLLELINECLDVFFNEVEGVATRVAVRFSHGNLSAKRINAGVDKVCVFTTLYLAFFHFCPFVACRIIISGYGVNSKNSLAQLASFGSNLFL